MHNLYRSLFNRGPEWFKTVATPDAYLSELAGIELILGAADTMLVNIPVCWMASRLYDLGLGLGFFGHINLAMSIVTYILNTWLFADKSPIIDTYRWQNGGTPNFCPTSSAGLAEFLVWLLLFPVAWIAMGFTALPALQLLRSGFDPRAMRLNWCCVPRFHHHRTRGFGQNDAVAVVLDKDRFPWLQQKSWKLWLSSDQRREMLPSLDRNLGNESLHPLFVEYEAQQRRDRIRAERSAASAAARAAAAGMSQAMMLSLPTMIYQARACDDEPSEALCSICYEAVAPGSRIFVMQCPHVQHYDCMKLWIVRKPECPECRQSLPVANVAAATTPLDLSSAGVEMAPPGTSRQGQRVDVATDEFTGLSQDVDTNVVSANPMAGLPPPAPDVGERNNAETIAVDDTSVG